MPLTIDLVPAELKKYVGIRYHRETQHERIPQMAFSLANECLAAGDTPFGRFSRNGILLNDQTRSFIYDTDFGKIRQPYVKGTYLALEDYIDSVIKPGMTDGQKVVALSQSMHYDLVKRFPKVPVFLYGESDQETLLKGAGHCSCRARLLCALCQILGISARPVMQWPWHDPNGADPNRMLSGHTVAEVFINGHWGFFDPQHHLYCSDGKDRFYSVDEIVRQPEYFTRMPKSLTQEMAAVGYPGEDDGKDLFEYYHYKNFNKLTPIQITQHDVNTPYRGGWFWATPEVREGQRYDFDRNRKLLRELADRGELTEEVYQLNLDQFRARFNITDGKLKSRSNHIDFVGRPRSV